MDKVEKYLTEIKRGKKINLSKACKLCGNKKGVKVQAADMEGGATWVECSKCGDMIPGTHKYRTFKMR